MTHFILVPLGTQTNLTAITFGVMRALTQNGRQPLYFKPIADGCHSTDSNDAATQFAHTLFHQNPPQPLNLAQVTDILISGQDDDLIDAVLVKFNQLAQMPHDVVVTEGVVADSRHRYLANKNIHLAASLNAQAVLVVNADNATPAQVAEQLYFTWREYTRNHAEVAGFILNEFNDAATAADYVKAVQATLPATMQPLACLGVIPCAPDINAERMADIAHYLNAEVLSGSDGLAERRVQNIVVAGQQATLMHEQLQPGTLIIAPGDRADVMMACALKTLAGVPLAGLILSCNSEIAAPLHDIITPLLTSPLPILRTSLDTYQTAHALLRRPRHIPGDDRQRMENTVDFVARHLQPQALCRDTDQPAGLRLSPPAFRYHMMEQARAAGKRIVLPEGSEPRTIAAAAICQNKGIAQCILLAKPTEVANVAKSKGITLPAGLEIIDPDDIRSRYIEPMVALRKHKGLTPELAEKQLQDTVVLGTMMLSAGDVDGLVSGAVHTTANTIRPALQLIKTAPGASLVSSVFFMLMPEQVLVYGDCAVNPNPSAEELADIAIQSADSARAFGIDPKVAMISYSTGHSGSGADVEKVTTATALARAKRPDLLIDGPLQYDAASVPSVGRQKAPDSPVAGQATVFVFPDLNTGNTTYKAVQRSANVLSVGPMLQGLNKPVNDLSRGALVDDIVYTIAITAIQATRMAAKA